MCLPISRSDFACCADALESDYVRVTVGVIILESPILAMHNTHARPSLRTQQLFQRRISSVGCMVDIDCQQLFQNFWIRSCLLSQNLVLHLPKDAVQ